MDETAIARLLRAGAPIDAFGVGTRVGVSADAPYLDSVYKLVQYGERPVMKLSAGKATAPGEKQVFRSDAGDVIGLRDETAPDGAEPILVQVMAGGRRTHADRISQARVRFQGDLARLANARGVSQCRG